MIVVTGGEGFIGKNLIKELEKRGNIAVVSLDTKNEKLHSISNWLMSHSKDIDCIFHLGAITDTTEMDENKFDEYNVNCSIFIWQLCAAHKIPLIYASSAATYGSGENGFDDNETILNLQPLNPYGWSKQKIDLYTTTTNLAPPFWYGLKFFNVYGYGEEHKGKMSSVALQLFNQLNETGHIKLFKSHNPNYIDGGQLRDFIYIDDVVDICIYMYEKKPISGIYNVGTGKARTFYDLAKSVYMSYYDIDYNKPRSFIDTATIVNKAFEFHENLSYFPIPLEIRDKYQYFTEATIAKLRNTGYTNSFHELEEGIKKYINQLR